MTEFEKMIFSKDFKGYEELTIGFEDVVHS